MFLLLFVYATHSGSYIEITNTNRIRALAQLELPRPIPWNQTTDVHQRVFFDIVTLTSQKPYQHNSKFDCSETNGYNIPECAINEVYVCVFFQYSDILLKKHKLH